VSDFSLFEIDNPALKPDFILAMRSTIRLPNEDYKDNMIDMIKNKLKP
jgi:hypothetical protein